MAAAGGGSDAAHDDAIGNATGSPPFTVLPENEPGMRSNERREMFPISSGEAVHWKLARTSCVAVIKATRQIFTLPQRNVREAR